MNIDIKQLAKELSDSDIKAILALRGTLIKERMAYKLLLQMEHCLDDPRDGGGVPVIHKGEVTMHIRPSPGELFRIQQTLENFNPEDFGTLAKANRDESIVSGLKNDPSISPEKLREILGTKGESE